jgi:hypothetical protein
MKGYTMTRNIIFLQFETVDATTRRLVCTVNNNTRIAEIDITDVEPAERAMELLELAEADQHLKDFLTDAVNAFVKQELLAYLEATVEPHTYLEPLHDVLSTIQEQYKALYQGGQK